ncbi:MAG: hypothetical protein PHH08_01700 [Candidatus ainarchaeum sp.]|nr:hypothetical protein [Candidatus ainarchaeum sp.]
MGPLEVYEKLLSCYGKQNWWPVTEQGAIAPTYKARKRLSENQKFEIALGAILAQNTAWKNAEKAIINLNKAGVLDCGKIANAKQAGLAQLIRPSGYYNQKAKKLILFAKYLQKQYGCKISKMFEKEIPELRKELLDLHGVGEETADSIILYSAGKPIFVVDAYTRRLGGRIFYRPMNSYVDTQEFFQKNLPKDLALFQEFHALIVAHSKRFCGKKPCCEECFLNNTCQFFLSGKNEKD